ncbi:hypothetical protein ACI65C_006683 [Semiaphis heraclei]
MENSEPSNDVEVNNNKSGLTIEPVIMLMFLGIQANLMVQTNLFEERVCLHSDLGQNKSVNCYNMTASDQEIVQPTVADLQMIKHLIETSVPCITAFFLGPWSDINGRLPLLLTAISGGKNGDIKLYVQCISTISSLSPIMFLLCSIPVAISGGTGTLFMAASCYVVEVADYKSRAFSNNYRLYKFIINSLKFVIVLNYFSQEVIITNHETNDPDPTSKHTTCGFTFLVKLGADKKLFNIKLVKDMWQTITKRRFGFLRCIIVLSAALLTLNLIILLGEDSFMYMYLQKQFLWTLENYTPFYAYTTLIHATIPVIGLYVLNTKLQFPEMYIGIAAAALGIFEKIGLAYSVHRWQFYAMKTVGYNVYISQSLIRSQLSKSIPPEDLCKIFAFLGMIENFGELLYSPLYTAVYVSTIHDFANCFFFLSAILNTLVFVLFGAISFLLSRSTITDDLLIENQF